MRSYRFGHVDGAITRDGNVRIEILNAQLLAARSSHPTQRDKPDQDNKRKPARCCLCEPIAHAAAMFYKHGSGPLHAHADAAAGVLKLTLGASRSARAEISKNSRGLNPSILAKMLVGNS